MVHKEGNVARVRTLLEKTHEWRNRKVLIDLSFVRFGADRVDALEGAELKATQARAIRAESATLPVASFLARGDSRGEFVVAEMHSVLSDAWAPDRSSPPVHVYWRGARLAIQPQLSANESQCLDLRVKRHRLQRMAPRRVAGTVLQQPIDSIWSHQRPLHLQSGASVITGLL